MLIWLPPLDERQFIGDYYNQTVKMVSDAVRRNRAGTYTAWFPSQRI